MPKLPANIQKTLSDAAKAAAKEQEEKDKKKREQKKKEESLVKKVGHTLKQIYYGPKYHEKVTKKAKPIITTRTKAIKKGLKSAGLTKEEIKRLRGKK